jgi:predicted alpha/beta superfamily hydrolase
VVADLLPRLAANYHARTDAAGLALGGSSMGGLVTLWIAILFPGLFGRLIVMSPSLWWDRRVVLRHLRKHELEPLPRIWLDAGRREGAAVTRDARELHRLLRRQSRTSARYVIQRRAGAGDSRRRWCGCMGRKGRRTKLKRKTVYAAMVNGATVVNWAG